MGEVVAGAAELATALETTSLELFERLSQLPADYVPQAQATVETSARMLVTRDEHVSRTGPGVTGGAGSGA